MVICRVNFHLSLPPLYSGFLYPFFHTVLFLNAISFSQATILRKAITQKPLSRIIQTKKKKDIINVIDLWALIEYLSHCPAINKYQTPSGFNKSKLEHPGLLFALFIIFCCWWWIFKYFTNNTDVHPSRWLAEAVVQPSADTQNPLLPLMKKLMGHFLIYQFTFYNLSIQMIYKTLRN